jgi:hypothetical protein
LAPADAGGKLSREQFVSGWQQTDEANESVDGARFNMLLWGQLIQYFLWEKRSKVKPCAFFLVFDRSGVRLAHSGVRRVILQLVKQAIQEIESDNLRSKAIFIIRKIINGR